LLETGVSSSARTNVEHADEGSRDGVYRQRGSEVADYNDALTYPIYVETARCAYATVWVLIYVTIENFLKLREVVGDEDVVSIGN
jgi:hypothetical protein